MADFLDDLDGLGESGSEGEEEEEGLDTKRQRLADQLGDLDDLDDGDEDAMDESTEHIDDSETSQELQALIGKIRGGMGIANLIKIRKSEKFQKHIADIAAADSSNSQNISVTGRLEDDNDYQMIIASNKLISELDGEFDNIHRFVAEKWVCEFFNQNPSHYSLLSPTFRLPRTFDQSIRYTKKFPELEGLIPNKLDYLKTVQRIGNEMDMTLIDLNDLLPSASVMVVSVTGKDT
jgi:U4/U6 small nuclear ribonucleoprotein PRP31